MRSRKLVCPLITVAALLIGTVGISHAQPEFGAVVPVPNINFPGPDWSTSILPGQEGIPARFYFTSVRGGGEDIWVATWDDGTDSWAAPENIRGLVNSEFTETNPTVFDDGQTLSLFFSDYLDAAEPKLRPGGRGGGDLWISTWDAGAASWTDAQNLDVLNTTSNDAWQTLSADGQTIIFASDRSGGFGETDLWMSTWNAGASSWNPPTNLGDTVNSDAFEGAPALSPDGSMLFFGSRRSGGFGGNDLWLSMWDEAKSAWQTPMLLPEPINSAAWEGDVAISPDGSTLYFTSDRNVGDAGFFGIYQVAIVPEPSGTALLLVGLVGLFALGERGTGWKRD